MTHVRRSSRFILLAAALAPLPNTGAVRADVPTTTTTPTQPSAALPPLDQPIDFGMDWLPIPRQELVPTITPRTVELLAAAAKRDAGAIRVQRLRDLGATSQPAAAPALIGAMGDPDPVLRAQACRSAAAVNDPSLRDPVVKLMHDDDDPTVRREAVLAAAAMGEASAVPVGLKDQDATVVRAALSAAKPADAAVIADALPNLPDLLRPAAAAALARVGATAQAAALRPLLSSDVPQQAAALRALGQLKATGYTDLTWESMSARHPTVRRAFVEAVQGIYPDAAARQKVAVAALADPDPTVRAAAADLLAANPTPDAVDALVEQVRHPLEGYVPLHDAARDAVAAAGDAGTRAAVAFLSDPDPRRREDGSYVLGRQQSKAALERHIKLLEDFSDWGVVAQACKSLYAIRPTDEQAGAQFQAVAERVLRAVGKIGKPDPADVGGGVNGAAIGEAGEYSVLACGRIGHRQVVPVCVQLLPWSMNDPTPGHMRAAAVWAIGVLVPQNDPVGAKLLPMYQNQFESTDVDFESFKALGNMRYKAAADTFKNYTTIPGIGGTPALRWMAHEAYDRITGVRTPFEPLGPAPHVPDVSIQDTTPQ